MRFVERTLTIGAAPADRGTEVLAMRFRPVSPVLCAVLALVLGSACVSKRPLRTASGRPEITIQQTHPAELMPILVRDMVSQGFRLTNLGTHRAEFQAPVEDFETAFFLGPGWNADATYRIVCSLSDQPGMVRVLTDIQIVADAGKPSEERTQAPDGLEIAHGIQEILEIVKAAVILRRHEEAWTRPDPADPSSVVFTGGEGGG
jgi:hypothetical protein